MNDFMKVVIERLKNEGQHGTVHVYQSVFNAFSRYWNQRRKGTMKLEIVFTPAVLQDFEKYLLEHMLKMNTVSLYTKTMQTIYHIAIHEKRVKWRKGMLHNKYASLKTKIEMK